MKKLIQISLSNRPDQNEDLLHEEEIDSGTDEKFAAKVVVYNNDYNTFDEVAYIISKATGCSLEKGYQHAMNIHTKGKDIVYSGEFLTCLKVSEIIQTIGIKTEIIY